jgi:hypothetical protein
MVLKVIRLLQWLIGIALFVYGVYLIFGVQEFFGTIAIIAAFLIFPSLETKKTSKLYSNDSYYASAYDTDESDDWESDDNDTGGDSSSDSDSGDTDD